MSIFVGIDAGGSSTACVVERDGALAHANGLGANLRTVGVPVAAERIVALLRETLGAQQPDAIAIGAAGAGDATLAGALRERIEGAFDGARVAVHDDALIALRAAVPSGDGIVLVAGTGSIAYGVIDDRIVRAGGYGALLGDEGSAFAIGRAAVLLALRAADGRAPTDPFAAAIAAEIGASEGPAIAGRVLDASDTISAVASLAPLVVERASAGERSAAKIVQGAAMELCELVKAVVKRADAGARDLPLVLAGGLLETNSLLTYLIETRLNADLPLLATQRAALAPVFGALSLARRLALQ